MERNKKKITMEEYLQFCQQYSSSWRSSNISRSHLNQIIEMHGFVKRHRLCMSDLQECVDSIELMEPQRSTLEESVYRCAVLTPIEIAADLDALGWRERSPIRSVQTLEFPAADRDVVIGLIATEDLSSVPVSAAGEPCQRLFRAPPADFVVAGATRPRTRRKRASVNAIVSAGMSASFVEVGGGGEGFNPPLPLSPLPASPSPPAQSSPPSPASVSLNQVADDGEGFIPPLPLSPPPVTPPPPPLDDLY